MRKFEKQIEQAFIALKNESDLSPNNKKVNCILNQLISCASSYHKCNYCSSFSKKTSKILPEFRSICSKAEYEMEKFWAKYFCNLNNLNPENLQEFWYYNNYEAIAKKETLLINKHCPANKKLKMLFAGSGPLPLSAILMDKYSNLDISLLDIDSEAIELSKTLLAKLGLDFKVINADIQNFDTKDFDIVFIASLIPNKEKIIEKIKNQTTSYYMTRGVDGIYRAFYEDLSYSIKTSSAYIYMPSDDKTLNSSYLFLADKCA